MKKPAQVIAILVVIVMALSIVRTYVSNNLATSGIMLSKIESDIEKLQTQNSIIAEKLYENSSLSSLYDKANKIGYVKDANSFVVNSGVPIASKQ